MQHAVPALDRWDHTELPGLYEVGGMRVTADSAPSAEATVARILVRRYIHGLRDPQERAYATAYSSWLQRTLPGKRHDVMYLDFHGHAPTDVGLSKIASQSVRFNLTQILED